MLVIFVCAFNAQISFAWMERKRSRKTQTKLN